MGKPKLLSILFRASMIVLSLGVANSIAEESLQNQAKPSKTQPVAITSVPVQPKTPQCYGFFPGTPGWNDCFQKFMLDMADYQVKMHEYLKNKQGQVDVEAAGVESSASEDVRYQHYSSKSTSSALVGGYAIKAINMPISSSINNNILKVTLFAGRIDPDTYDCKDDKNEILITLKSKGQPRSVKVIVPKGVNLKDVMVERTEDTILLTGPVSTDGSSSFQYSQSSYNSGGSVGTGSSINQAVGQIPPMVAIPIPPLQFPPILDFSNMFQDLFGIPKAAGASASVSASARKDRARSVMDEQPQQYPYYYAPPQVWFY